MQSFEQRFKDIALFIVNSRIVAYDLKKLVVKHGMMLARESIAENDFDPLVSAKFIRKTLVEYGIYKFCEIPFALEADKFLNDFIGVCDEKTAKAERSESLSNQQS